MISFMVGRLFWEFLEKDCCAQLQVDKSWKHNIPRLITKEIQVEAEDKKLKRGDLDWSVSNDDIACMKWKDKKIEHILTTLDEATKSCEIEWKEKDGEKTKIACQKAVIVYNMNMGYIDNFDQLKSMYKIERK
ncbi:DDE_Tnp_1_7 domain-containing protein [Trichonephila clavipes]|nr:DDE_Tnp_1_7 domain-containing protein [Trichonephila clavipes]